MTWCIRDLFVDHKTGKLRETLVWSNIGKAVITWAFIYTVLQQKSAFSEALWMIYGGLVVSHELASRWLNQRQQKIDKQTPEPA